MYRRGERCLVRPPQSASDQTLIGATVIKAERNGNVKVVLDRKGYQLWFDNHGWEMVESDPAQLIPYDADLIALAEEANERRELVTAIQQTCYQIGNSKLGILRTSTLRFMAKVLNDLATRTE